MPKLTTKTESSHSQLIKMQSSIVEQKVNEFSSQASNGTNPVPCRNVVQCLRAFRPVDTKNTQNLSNPNHVTSSPTQSRWSHRFSSRRLWRRRWRRNPDPNPIRESKTCNQVSWHHKSRKPIPISVNLFRFTLPGWRYWNYFRIMIWRPKGEDVDRQMDFFS